jgi:hypothetical protein
MTMNIHNLRASIDQSRSRYQIERFVVGQHHTPEMQYVQLVRELSTLHDAYEEGLLRAEKMLAEADELRATGKKSDAIEAELKERGAASVRRGLEGTKREIGIMQDMLDGYPAFTRDEIEAAQEQYWQERLVRVAHMQALAGGVGWAHIEALWQADALPELMTTNPLEALMTAGPPTLPGTENTDD